jgi:hypothetical protein
MAELYKGKVKFLIHEDTLHINNVPSAPAHIVIACLSGMVNEETARNIILAGIDNMTALAGRLLGQSILGGYCRLVYDNPPRYEYLRGSTSVPSADENAFEEAQKQQIVFHEFKDADRKTAGLPL